MSKIKKILSVVFILFFVISVTFPVHAVTAPVKAYNLTVNGKKVTDANSGKKINGMVYIGVRSVSKSAGIEASWNSEENIMTLVNGKYTILVKAESSKITVNGKVFLLNGKARLIENKLYVPTGFFTKNTGFSISVIKEKIAVKTLTNIKPSGKPENTPKPSVKPTGKPSVTPKPTVSVKPTTTPKPTGKPVVTKKPTPTTEDVIETPTPTIQIGPTAEVTESPTSSVTPTPPVVTVAPDLRNSITEISNGVELGIFFVQIKGDQELQMMDTKASDGSSIAFDISGARLDIAERTVSVYNDFCTTMSYNSPKDKKNTVRVKLLTKKMTSYKIQYSEDRKSVKILFQNELKGISITQKGADEVLKLTGIPYGDWRMTYEKTDNKIVLVADRAVNTGAAAESLSKFAKRISVFASGDGKLTVEMYLIDGLFYKSKNTNGEMELTFSESPFNFMSYTKFGTTAITELNFGKNRVPSFNLDRANGTYSISAKGNFDKLITSVTKLDNLIGGYQIKVTPDGAEKLTTVTFQILSTTEPEILLNDSGVVKIRFTKRVTLPSQLTIAIDPGHGGKDSGAVGYLNNAVIYEKKVNLDVALRLDRILRENGFNTMMTRNTDATLDLMTRGPSANKINADFFISIHHNSAASATANGLSTLYKLYDVSDLKPVTNKVIASLFQQNLLKDLNRGNIGISHRPELAVLRTTEMPSLLMELGFLQNKSDLTEIVKSQYREMAARSLAVSIIEYFNTLQGSHLEIDTTAIRKRPMVADAWQKYYEIVPAPPAYVPGMDNGLYPAVITPVPTVDPGNPTITPEPTVVPTETPVVSPAPNGNPTPTPESIVIPKDRSDR